MAMLRKSSVQPSLPGSNSDGGVFIASTGGSMTQLMPRPSGAPKADPKWLRPYPWDEQI